MTPQPVIFFWTCSLFACYNDMQLPYVSSQPFGRFCLEPRGTRTRVTVDIQN